MAAKTFVDDSTFQKAIDAVKITRSGLLAISGAGAANIVTAQKTLVPVDTAATKNSIKSHIVKANDEIVIDEIGAETSYAPYIEYGHDDPESNYPMQPFVRPSVFGREKSIYADIGNAYAMFIIRNWNGESSKGLMAI